MYSALIASGLLAVLSTYDAQISNCLAQGTMISYQGQLEVNGVPANGEYGFRFRSYDLPTFCSDPASEWRQMHRSTPQSPFFRADQN